MHRNPRFSVSRLALAAVVLLTSVAAASPALALTRTQQRLDLRGYSVAAENNSLRYLHSTWFVANYRFKTVAVKTLTEVPGSATSTASIEVLVPFAGFRGADAEPLVREQASASYATALALSNGTYNPPRVRVNAADALRRVVAWNNALAISHARDGWAGSWQSGLWVYYLGASSKRVWNSMPTSTQELVTQAVTGEANRLLLTWPPYYRNAAGRIVSPGDSKSEENGWNAALLFLAAREWPDDPNAARWETWARWYAVTAYSSPSQVGTDPRILGSNINSDGTVVNRGIVHPDYMATCGEMLVKDQLIADWTGTQIASEAPNGLWPVWLGLTHVKFSPKKWASPGGTIYRVDGKGRPTSQIYYPQGSSISKYRRHNHALMDVTAFVFKLDSTTYARGRAQILAALTQQARHFDGRIFSPGETSFPEDEQFGAVCMAEIVDVLTPDR